MKKINKPLFYTFILLFLISVHKDLTVGTPLNNDTDGQNEQNLKMSAEQETITIIKVQVQQGDTVLSIVEAINQQRNHVNQLDISQVLSDFRTLNPGVEPLNIETGNYYYFPAY
ncbi:hypothetical protein [Lentibacillus salinarum]|uniref:LysM domain-containing protein n=1 Tax=Lentibacillus salinarum TaxID=446820 RepID=A0ABW3ZXP1_9BACI